MWPIGNKGDNIEKSTWKKLVFLKERNERKKERMLIRI